MAEHWDTATFVLETLVWKAYQLDPDGPDLVFIRHGVKLDSSKHPEKFRKAMQGLRKQHSTSKKTTIMKSTLESILNAYIGKRSSAEQMSKNLTIIVLTDGLWTATEDCEEFVKAIAHFKERLSAAMKTIVRPRQVTIQFVQFGKDRNAVEKLIYLDDHPIVGYVFYVFLYAIC